MIIFTAITCPNGFVYTECAPSCSRTCQNLYNVQPDTCYNQCSPGCQCAQGTILDNDECVRPENCTCTYQDKRYNAQDVVKVNCNHWWVTNEKCPFTGKFIPTLYFLIYIVLICEWNTWYKTESWTIYAHVCICTHK